MKRFCMAVLAVFMASAAAGCERKPVMYERSEELFGTFVSVRIAAPDEKTASDALDAAFRKAEELEFLFSPSIPESELNAVNASAVTQETEASAIFCELLRESLVFSEISGGAFDCGIGTLISLWGIGTERAGVPSGTKIAELLHPPAHEVISVNENTMRFSDKRVQLHFGAIAKGFIADEMKETLLGHGIESGTLSLGGNILTLGCKNEDEPWVIGITDPFSPDRITATVEVRDLSVVTSGGYERYFEENGVSYHHILDPRTGYPSDSGLAGATILAESSMQCDALSTAVFVLGAQDGLALIEGLEGVECVLITEDGTILQSSGMDAYHLKQVTE